MVFNNPEITGIDIATMHIFPPISILLAIELSPESLQILTANSVSIAIPVIFNNIPKNSPPRLVLFAKLFNNDTIPDNLSKLIKSISPPANNDTYRLNSGLYCFNNGN